ncbi:MAG: TonB family protein [Candidatus Eisenbacteria bacterium]
MALSEYMPYGAPELLAGAEARLARATGVASLAIALLVGLVGAVGLRVMSRAASPAPDARIVEFLPPIDLHELLTWTPPSGTPPATADPHAEVRPLPGRPDDIEPVFADTRPTLASGAVAGPAGPIGAVPAGPIVVAPEDDPPAGTFVFAEEYPNLVRCEEPRYPDLAREAGVEGTVHVLVLVGLDGRVRNAVIAPGGSVPMLDEAALVAARTCVFTPALVGAHPVKVWVSRRYRFRLH